MGRIAQQFGREYTTNSEYCKPKMKFLLLIVKQMGRCGMLDFEFWCRMCKIPRACARLIYGHHTHGEELHRGTGLQSRLNAP